uniref:ABC transporter domain-containing protein n=1 Tax=Spongospora subterranea TaxID=70186 RepID=A0A0H5QJ62_9EUKA|eukprot:CRZ01331.1 hypothetical protein [Spongospora subterranea]
MAMNNNGRAGSWDGSIQMMPISSAGAVDLQMRDPLSFGKVPPITIGVNVATVRTPGKSTLLEKINVHIPSGSLLAIMGGSGSGKTTLLKVMAGRTAGLKISGDVFFNGKRLSEEIRQRSMGYVHQQDTLLPYLSVRDTLRYAARLRLPQSLSTADRNDLVEKVILELGLKDCSTTMIGDEWKKGISGGEKRRVSVATQLLVNPSVIFMDEPTTGLDAFSAKSLVETLVSLCKRGRTIIVSIHQPRSDIFSLFNQVVLLAKGRLVYAGSRETVFSYFNILGCHVPDGVNGADFLIDISTVDLRAEDTLLTSRARVAKLIDAWHSESHTSTFTKSDFDASGLNASYPDGVKALCQIRVLSGRFFVNMISDRLTVLGTFAQMLFLSLAIGLIFFQLDESPAGLLARKSALYIISSLQSYLSLMFIIWKLCNEMIVFDRERMDRMYSVFAYLCSWFLVNTVLYFVLAVCFSLIVYPMVGFRSDHLIFHFSIFCLCILMLQLVTISFAFLCVSISRDFALSSLIANGIFTFISLSSGFFIPINAIPVYLKWIQHIGYVSYCLQIFASNEFDGNEYNCPSIPPGSPGCSGNAMLLQLGFVANIIFPFFMLVVLFFSMMIIAALILQLFPKGRGSHSNKYESSFAANGFQIEPPAQIAPINTVPAVTVEVDNLSYTLHRRQMFSRSTVVIPVLQSINARFSPGKLTAIMGASGCGKSTFLQLLHCKQPRVNSSITWDSAGRILHNGVMLSANQVEKVTASVRQEDSHLLPALTARETLYYAAMLRLPHLQKKERVAKAEAVITELQLSECANTAVGGPKCKGLSGGEKRRVSVGLAMLTDPAVLLLDEPTSGLDAATAKSMIMSLKAIALSGRTVVCTIHQPRSDIVPFFDYVLLLAHGGLVVFFGTIPEMIGHFTNMGFPMPQLTNPADFAIDLASIDLRNKDSEDASSSRVVSLVNAWAVITTPNTLSVFAGSGNLQRLHKKSMSSLLAMPLLLSRSLRNISRQVEVIFARLMQMVTLGLVLAAYFTPLGHDQASATNRIGLLQQTGSLVFIGMLNCISIFPQELKLFRFESQDYSIGTFFLTYTAIEIPFEIVGCLLWASISNFMIGLEISFTLNAFVAFALVNAGESIGIAFCSLISEPGFSVQIMSSFISIMCIMAGFLSINMPEFLDVINRISMIRYVARAQAAQEFRSMTFSCPDHTTCQFGTGSEVLSLLRFDSSDSGFFSAIIGICATMICCV